MTIVILGLDGFIEYCLKQSLYVFCRLSAAFTEIGLPKNPIEGLENLN